MIYFLKLLFCVQHGMHFQRIKQLLQRRELINGGIELKVLLFELLYFLLLRIQHAVPAYYLRDKEHKQNNQNEKDDSKLIRGDIHIFSRYFPI